MKPATSIKVVWFARGGNIAHAGPFATQEKAVNIVLGENGFPVSGAFVWPVTVQS